MKTKFYQASLIPGLFIIILFSFFISCSSPKAKAEIEAEIIEIENQFCKRARENGIAEAFLFYAAEDAVLNRNDVLIKGKEEIKKYFDKQTISDIKLDWAADFVDVAASGDLAYTYGKYTFSAISAKGDSINSQGIFHTVWKKQLDGSWKYVWD